MQNYGTASIADLLGDYVAYRNLRPADTRLPGLAELASGPPPRKGEPAYAKVVAAILAAARTIEAPGTELRRILLIGDTRRSDVGCFSGIVAETGWVGRCFICDEVAGAAPLIRREEAVAYANQWQALYSFAAALEAEELPVDAATVVVIDLDKTLIGARGRNHSIIDAARLRALRATVAELLGDAFEQASFEAVYRELDQARYHGLTEDNQDYLAYLCVMSGAGALSLEELVAMPERNFRFTDALTLAGAHLPDTSSGLAAFHQEIARLVAAGDPTPFKAFRRREYAETAARMGIVPDGMAVEQLLKEELVLTHEVWEVARQWQKRGALLFGLSDKPDEAAIPDSQAASEGALALHRLKTHLVGV